MSQTITVYCDRCDEVITERGSRAVVDRFRVEGVEFRARIMFDQLGERETDLCAACILVAAAALKAAM